MCTACTIVTSISNLSLVSQCTRSNTYVSFARMPQFDFVFIHMIARPIQIIFLVSFHLCTFTSPPFTSFSTAFTCCCRQQPRTQVGKTICNLTNSITCTIENSNATMDLHRSRWIICLALSERRCMGNQKRTRVQFPYPGRLRTLHNQSVPSQRRNLQTHHRLRRSHTKFPADSTYTWHTLL